MGFWSLLLPLWGMAMVVAVLPAAIGFSSPQTTLQRVPKTIRKSVFSHGEHISGAFADGQAGLDAASFFEFAGIDLDPETFLVEEALVFGPTGDLDPTDFIYSAEGCIRKGPGANGFSTRIYWTIPKVLGEEESDDENGNLKQILQAFEGIVSSCWIEQNATEGSSQRKLVRTPDELMSVVAALALDEQEKSEAITTSTFGEGLLLSDNNGESQINQAAIDESSLKCQIILDRNGFVFEAFSAKAENQTIWWRTLNMDHDKNPYGDLSGVWTDDQFSALVPLLRRDEDKWFLRTFSIRLKRLAILTRRNASQIPLFFRRQDPESPIRKAPQKFPKHITLIAQRLVLIAGIILFWGAGPFRMSSVAKIVHDIILVGMAKNRPYVVSMAIWLLSVLALDAIFKPILQQKLPLNSKSPIIEHLTTFSIAMQSVGIFLHAIQDYIDLLLRVPILAFLKLLASMNAVWRRKETTTNYSLFDGLIARLISWKGDESRPFWMDAVILAPVREELVFRFAFDRVWHGFLGIVGLKTLSSWNSSRSLQPVWVWVNSLLFGLVHACNWLPVQNRTSSTADRTDLGDDATDVWEKVLGALFQTTGSFLTAFFVFNPLYIRHGLPASICAHSILNSVFVGFPSLFIRVRKFANNGIEFENV